MAHRRKCFGIAEPVFVEDLHDRVRDCHSKVRILAVPVEMDAAMPAASRLTVQDDASQPELFQSDPESSVLLREP